MFTFESLVKFDDVGMVQTCHGVNFLKEKLFEKGVFDHFLFRDALDSVKGGGRCGFGGEEYMSETSLSQSADGVEMVGVEDIFGLDLQVAFEHDVSSMENKVNELKYNLKTLKKYIGG